MVVLVVLLVVVRLVVVVLVVGAGVRDPLGVVVDADLVWRVVIMPAREGVTCAIDSGDATGTFCTGRTCRRRRRWQWSGRRRRLEGGTCAGSVWGPRSNRRSVPVEVSWRSQRSAARRVIFERVV